MSILSRIDIQMNNILLLIKQISKYSTETSLPNLILFENESTNAILRTSKNNNENANLSNKSSLILEKNQTDKITLANFLSSHLCNRDIHDLPLSQRNSKDFDRLHSCFILTMTDLIGRYLIHRTPDDFRNFLVEKVQCTEAFTEEVIQLMDIWILHNLQIGRGARTTTLKQYI